MRVVIVGGGFGGVRSALKLANVPGIQVKLISDKSYFEYHAALYRSATGRSPLEVAIPLRDFFAKDTNIEVVKDTIVSLDYAKKCVSGSSEADYHYDVLILAMGAVTQYFGIQGLAKFSYGVKTIQEALALKRHLHDNLVAAQGAEQNYVVIGGGATGVELSAELVTYLKHIRKRHGVAAKFNVDLIEASPQLMPSLPSKIASKITTRLRKLGVNLYLSTAVESESLDKIKLPRGELTSHTVVWTAGVANNPFFAKYPGTFKLGKGGKVVVNNFLEASRGIYVIGDSAITQYSGMAQTAIHDANLVTTNLLRAHKGSAQTPYRPSKPAYAIPVGRRWSAVLWNGVTICGRAGWVLRRLADLRLYLKFLPLGKALTAWRYGAVSDEVCTLCKQ